MAPAIAVFLFFLCAEEMMRAAVARLPRCAMALQNHRRQPLTALAASPKNLLALDFDGVVCASSSESSFSSIVAAQRFWPTVCGDIIQASAGAPSSSSYAPLVTEGPGTPFAQIRAAVDELRPIVETGYENMLLVRALHEELRVTGVASAPAMHARWSAPYRDSLLTAYGATKEELVAFFGQTRDALIAEDVQAWVGLNPVYEPVRACLSGANVEYTIITTKQERFVRAILESNGIAPPPRGDIYDLENPFGPKTKVLRALLDKHGAGVTIDFVEDRFETLQAVVATPGLEQVRCYLVDWGYNTGEQREAARRLGPRVTLVDGPQFQALVRQYC